MSLSSRDLEGIKESKFRDSWFFKTASFFVRLVEKIPFIAKKINQSEGGLSGAIFRCQAKGDHIQAIRIAVFALEKFRDKKSRLAPGMEHHSWWSFMRHAVESAKHTEHRGLKNKLISLAENGIEPFEGYYAAMAYLEFSRWRYRESNYDKAIEYAKVAAAADQTWAEPDFLLGWYGLVLSSGNAEYHLSRAVEKDRRILFRIVNDEICKQYPSITRKLKQSYLAEDDL